MKYGKVVNNKVVEFSDRPSSNRSSDLTKFPSLLKAEGWLPVDNKPVPSRSEWEELGPISDTVLATKISRVVSKRSVPLKDFKARKLRDLMKSAKSILHSRLDPVEQLPSVYKVLPQSRRDAMDSDASAVMAEVKSKRSLIKSAKSHLAVSMVYTGIVAFLDPADVGVDGFPIPKLPLGGVV